MNYKQKGIKNILFSLMSQLVTIGFGLILPRLFVVSYGSEVNGLLNSLSNFLICLNLFEAGTLTFEEPDIDTFEGLKLAFHAAEIGGSMPTVYNAANEKAVSLFLDKKIKFLQITELIGEAMANHKALQNPSVDEILAAEKEAHEFVIRGMCGE